MNGVIYKDESYKIIGCCIEVHKELGPGFLEVVYKDALEIEFQLNNIPYTRERSYIINYKGHQLKRTYNSDFILYDKIVLEVKHYKILSNDNVAQTLNYLKVSGCKLGILANFGEASFNSKRVLL